MKRFLQKWENSGRLLAVVGLIIFTFCFAMFQGGFVSWFVFFTVIPFLVYALLLALVPLRFVEVSRTVHPAHIERGERMEVTVRFRNKTWLPLIYVVVRELDLPDAFYHSLHMPPSQLLFVGFKRHFEWTYELRNVPRGEHRYEALHFTVTDFFGWIERTLVVDAPSTFHVYPKAVDIKNAALHMQYEQGTSATTFSIMKDTTIATGVRDYQPGDRFSWIHWKSFAKNGTLQTKEFEDRQSQKLYVYLDRTPQRDFDATVDMAASMVQSLIKARVDVSFISIGQNRIEYPDLRTNNQREKVFQHLVSVQADANNSPMTYLKKEAKLANGVLLITTSQLTDEMLNLMMTGSKFAKAIICFVIVSKDDIKHMHTHRQLSGENKIIYLTQERLVNAFAEVNKS